VAIITYRSDIDPTPRQSNDNENKKNVPLGTYLYESLSDSEIDSVEAIRELREEE